MSSTQFKFIDESPWHFKKIVMEKERITGNQLDLGTNAHQVNLERKLQQVVCPPNFLSIAEQKKNGVKNPIKIEDQKEIWLKENDESIIVTPAMKEQLTKMNEAFESDALVQSLIYEENEVEQGFLFFDEKHDLRCRFRTDIINIERGFIADYKTASRADFWGFRSAIKRYGYHVSAAHYMLGANRLFNDAIRDFYFIVQSTQAPYACAVYRLADIDLAYGHTTRDWCLTKIKECQQRDFWPGYTSEITEISTTPLEYEDEADRSKSIDF